MDCIFCKIINGDIPSYTVLENDYVKCFLDINPMANGHTLIIPKKHFLDINDIEDEYVLKVFDASKKIIALLKDKMNPSGFRLLQHNGSVQEVKHFHLHVIPIYENKDKIDTEEVYNMLIK